VLTCKSTFCCHDQNLFAKENANGSDSFCHWFFHHCHSGGYSLWHLQLQDHRQERRIQLQRAVPRPGLRCRLFQQPLQRLIRYYRS
jgi:hypothetical protein